MEEYPLYDGASEIELDDKREPVSPQDTDTTREKRPPSLTNVSNPSAKDNDSIQLAARDRQSSVTVNNSK